MPVVSARREALCPCRPDRSCATAASSSARPCRSEDGGVMCGGAFWAGGAALRSPGGDRFASGQVDDDARVQASPRGVGGGGDGAALPLDVCRTDLGRSLSPVKYHLVT